MFCVPGMALYLTGESPEGGQDSDKPIAKTKGVLREGESESRRRQNQNGLDFESLASVFKNYLVNIGSGTLTVVEREGFDPEEVTDSYHNFNHLYREGWDEVRSQRERKAELHFIEGGMKIESY